MAATTDYMNYTGNVFLVGPMGVGKTTIGRALADQMQLEFFDSDKEIEASTGADIPWIFDVEGEQGFRERELRMIDMLSKRKQLVLATGGGAILAKKTRKRLKKRGLVVYLRASIKQQVERTSRDKNRPLLRTENPEETIIKLMAQREPLYLEAAHIMVDTNRRNPRSVSAEIMRQIRMLQADESSAEGMGSDEG